MKIDRQPQLLLYQNPDLLPVYRMECLPESTESSDEKHLGTNLGSGKEFAGH